MIQLKISPHSKQRIMHTRLKSFLFNKYRLIGILTVVLVFSFTFTSLVSYNVTRTSIDSDAKTKILPLISDNIYSEYSERATAANLQFIDHGK